MQTVIAEAPANFNRAFDRWRELHRAAPRQMIEAQIALRRAKQRDEQEVSYISPCSIRNRLTTPAASPRRLQLEMVGLGLAGLINLGFLLLNQVVQFGQLRAAQSFNPRIVCPAGKIV